MRSARACVVNRWSQFPRHYEKLARDLLVRDGRRDVAVKLARNGATVAGLQPTGVFCGDAVELLAIGVPTRLAGDRWVGLIWSIEDSRCAHAHAYRIIHDQITQLGQAFEERRPTPERLVVPVRLAEIPFAGAPRGIEGAVEMLTMLEGSFGMRHVDLPRNPNSRFHVAYRSLATERAAEIYPQLPPALPADESLPRRTAAPAFPGRAACTAKCGCAIPGVGA